MRTPKNKLRECSLRNTGKNVKLWVGDPKSGSSLSWISWVAPWQVASHLRAHVPALLRPLSSGNENATSWGHPEDKGKHLWTRRAVPGICQRQNQRSRSSSSSLLLPLLEELGGAWWFENALYSQSLSSRKTKWRDQTHVKTQDLRKRSGLKSKTLHVVFSKQRENIVAEVWPFHCLPSYARSPGDDLRQISLGKQILSTPIIFKGRSECMANQPSSKNPPKEKIGIYPWGAFYVPRTYCLKFPNTTGISQTAPWL